MFIIATKSIVIVWSQLNDQNYLHNTDIFDFGYLMHFLYTFEIW